MALCSGQPTKARLLKPDYLIASVGTEFYQQGILEGLIYFNILPFTNSWRAMGYAPP
ncbi:hypothetical protein [Nostoc sp.]